MTGFYFYYRQVLSNSQKRDFVFELRKVKRSDIEVNQSLSDQINRNDKKRKLSRIILHSSERIENVNLEMVSLVTLLLEHGPNSLVPSKNHQQHSNFKMIIL